MGSGGFCGWCMVCWCLRVMSVMRWVEVFWFEVCSSCMKWYVRLFVVWCGLFSSF